MKNSKNLLSKVLVICVMIIACSCQKESIENENEYFLADQKSDKKEKYDEYTIEHPKYDGIHLVAKNRRTRSQLFMRIRESKVVGFQILKRDQSLVVFDRLVIPNSQNMPPWEPYSCPDGWDGQLICYTNEDGIPVSYFRCTPTSFTIGLEPEW